MENKIIGVVAMIVAIIALLGSVLVPIVDLSQATIGNPVTYTNAPSSDLPYYYGDIEDYTINVTYTSATEYEIMANDIGLTKSTYNYPVIMSDKVYVNVLESSNSNALMQIVLFGATYLDNVSIFVNTVGSYSIVVDGNTYSVTTPSQTYSGSIGWAYGIVPDGDYVVSFYSPNRYVHNFNNDVIMSGVYVTGELDTAYYFYKDGKVWTNSEFEGSINPTLTLVNGTTDIYRTTDYNITITDGETTETFPPGRMLIKNEVHGHESSGAGYFLLGALPLVVIVAIISTIAVMVIRTRD